MMVPNMNQGSGFGFIEKAKEGVRGGVQGIAEFKDNIFSFGKDVESAIVSIGDVCKGIVGFGKDVATIIENPVIITTAIRDLSVALIIVLIILKLIGFENVNKWITLLTIVAIVVTVL